MRNFIEKERYTIITVNKSFFNLEFCFSIRNIEGCLYHLFRNVKDTEYQIVYDDSIVFVNGVLGHNTTIMYDNFIKNEDRCPVCNSVHTSYPGPCVERAVNTHITLVRDGSNFYESTKDAMLMYASERNNV